MGCTRGTKLTQSPARMILRSTLAILLEAIIFTKTVWPFTSERTPSILSTLRRMCVPTPKPLEANIFSGSLILPSSASSSITPAEGSEALAAAAAGALCSDTDSHGKGSAAPVRCFAINKKSWPMACTVLYFFSSCCLIPRTWEVIAISIVPKAWMIRESVSHSLAPLSRRMLRTARIMLSASLTLGKRSLEVIFFTSATFTFCLK